MSLSKTYGEECFFVISCFPEHKSVLIFFPGSQVPSKIQHCSFLLPATKEHKIIYFLNSQIIWPRAVFNLCHLMPDESKKEEGREGSILTLTTWQKLERMLISPWGLVRKKQTVHKPKRCKLTRQTKAQIIALHVLSSLWNLWGLADHHFSDHRESCLAHSFWCKKCIHMR